MALGEKSFSAHGHGREKKCVMALSLVQAGNLACKCEGAIGQLDDLFQGGVRCCRFVIMGIQSPCSLENEGPALKKGLLFFWWNEERWFHLSSFGMDLQACKVRHP